MEYLFKTERLGFRKWCEADKAIYAQMNQDPDVMRYFPTLPTAEQSAEGIDRFNVHLEKNGYTYFAVDYLPDNTFIGFIGMYNQDYKSPYTPFTDIGWRLRKDYWGKGLATEGAQACLKFALEEKGLKEIYSVTTWNNEPSYNVMKKIGLEKIGEFVHPNMEPDHELQPMHVYRISK